MTEKIEIAIDHLLGLIVSAPLHEAENICTIAKSLDILNSVQRLQMLREKIASDPILSCYANYGSEPEGCGAEPTQSVGDEVGATPEVEKPKRTRRTKAEIEAERAALTAAPVEEPAAPVEEPAAPVEELAALADEELAALAEATGTENSEAVTRQTIRDYFIANKSAELKAQFAVLLTEYGAKSVTDVPDDKVAEFYNKLTA
jgi:hypothetical protein